LGFENTYALAMRQGQAQKLGAESIRDLVPFADKFTFGSDYEFLSRPEWTQLKDRYGLNFGRALSFDPALMYAAVQSGKVDVISAYSTDGRIAAFDLKVLKDTEEALPPYDAVLLLSPEHSTNSLLKEALEPLIGSIDDERMRSANKMVDLDGRSMGEAAAWLMAGIKGERETRPPTLEGSQLQ
jgi:osmoprotectant transport system permease protein